MANQEDIDRLKQGAEAWNQWRQENPEIKPDLSSASFRDANLSSVNLCYTNLISADFSGVNFIGANLIGADFRNAILSSADLRDANFRDVNLSRANLIGANLRGVDLSNINLSGANLRGVNFSRANLSNANFSNANLWGADLYGANFSNADLTNAKVNYADFSNANFSNANLWGANLAVSQALGTNLQSVILTGVCIEDWNTNSRTNLQDVICEYIFAKHDKEKDQFTDRRPRDPNQIFAPGEFTKRHQIVLETVDLFFNDGIDWKAFLASLNDLQAQYGNDLSVQGIEKKTGGAFLVRLEVPSSVDKCAIERQAKELYETKLQILEAKYHAELQAKDREIEIYKRINADMLELVKLAASRTINVEAKAVVDNQSKNTTYNMQGSKFGGGFAAEGGTQTGGTFNDFSQNIEQNINEIGGLIQALRSRAEAFPEGIRQEILDHLDDLETDIQQPPEKRKPSRIKATLFALAGTLTVISGAAAGANEFATNLQELSEKLNLPLSIEQVQPQSQQSDAIDVQAINSEQP